ncbi:MAG: MurR/RpiR family transcriptional regulator [Oscillospiraceae bacterium]|nr:MurR/RpiR family transcriptional regulator [Oscillospiraceae bacterium]
MENDILAVIERESASFSKGQRNIAKYILENYDKAAFMTAGKLGKTVGVSESTVVRFAAELGYDGYPEMRKVLQEVVRNKLTSVQRIEVATEQIDEENLIDSIMTADAERVRITLESVDREAFDRAVSAIVNAKKVYIIGTRASSSLATFFGYYMSLIMDNVAVVHDTAVSEVYEQLFRVGPGDVVIGISFPRYSSRTVAAMKYAKSRGAETIGITDCEASPLYGISNINLYARSDMVSFIDSLVAPMSLLNALLAEIGFCSRENISDTFRRLEDVWSEYAVFLTDDN